MGYVNGTDLHREMKYHGRKIIIDASYIDTETIEIMVMDADDIEGEYECKQTKYPEVAESIFRDMRYRYEDQPHKKLSGVYAKLRDDLKCAIEVARQNDTGDDGGTCNFDAPSIEGDRWRESMVKQAAKEAGTTVFKWKLWGCTRWVFGVPGDGQGNRRSRKAEAMTEALAAMGYEALMYCAAD